MAIKVHYEKTAKIDPLKKSTVAVVGYGSQGHAHAQNLRDSGIKVIVGNHNRTSPNAKLALKHGFDVLRSKPLMWLCARCPMSFCLRPTPLRLSRTSKLARC
jgi:ketol-acid reductoisomerase